MKHIARAVTSDVWSASVDRTSHDIYAKDKQEKRERSRAWKPNTLAIMANRIVNNEPVTEGFLWGRDAVRMITQGYIKESELAKHRNAFIKAYKDMYPKETVDKKINDLTYRHEYAKKHYDLL